MTGEADRRIPGICAALLLAVLMAAVLVAWSPRYWPVALLHVGVFLIGLVWLVNHAMCHGEVRLSLLFLPAGWIAIWGTVQLLLSTSVYRYQTVRSLLYWFANAVFLFLAAQILRRTALRETFFVVLACFIGLVAVVGLLQYFTSPFRVFWMFPIAQRARAVGPFVYRNQFAAMVELVLPFALYRVIEHRRYRWVFALLAAVLFAVVVATASRAGTLLVGTELLLVFVLGWSRNLISGHSLLITAGQVLVLTAVLTAVVGFQDVWSRFQQTNPYALRGKLAESTVRMVRSRPWMGYGLGTWQTVYPEFATFDNSLFANEAHNDWLQWTAEGGLSFGVALVALAAGSAVLAWRRIWGIGTVFVFAHSLIDYPTREPVVGAVMFVIIGAMIATDAQKGRRGRYQIEREDDARDPMEHLRFRNGRSAGVRSAPSAR